MVPRVVLGLAVALVLLAVSPASVVACTCAGPTTEASALQQADVAFVGVVSAVEDPNFLNWFTYSTGDPIRYAFVVEESRKGGVGEFVTVRSYRDGGACGVVMAVGERWSIYAHRQDLHYEMRHGELWVGLCDANERLATGVPTQGLTFTTLYTAPAEYIWLLLLTGSVIVVALLALFRFLDQRVSRGGRGQSPGTGAGQ